MRRYTKAFWGLLLCLFCLGTVCGAAPVEVTMMIPPNDTSRVQYETLRDRFNSQNSEVKLRIIWSDIGKKVHLLTAAGALPDIVVFADFDLVNYGQDLVDLGPYLKNDPTIKANQFYAPLLNNCRLDGKLLLIPRYYNVPLLYYRPDLFKAAGLAPPDSNWTWKEYRAAAKKLTQRNEKGEVQVWGTSIVRGWWVEWLSVIRQAGGDLMDSKGKLEIGSPKTDDGVQLMHDLVWEDKAAPPPLEEPSGGFLAGKYAMDYGGHVSNWLALRKSGKFDWDIAPLPAGPGGRATGEFATPGYGIWKGSQHSDAAWKVIAFFSTYDSGVLLCRAGLTPVRMDVARDEFLKGKIGQRAQAPQHREALIESLQFARSVPKVKNFSPLSSNIITPLIAAALKNPSPDAVKGLHTRLESESAGYLATLGDKAPANPWGFLVELVILGAVAYAGWHFYGRRTAMAAVVAQPGVDRYFFMFTGIWCLGILLFFVGPMAISFYWSHTSYDIVDKPTFVGLGQYDALFTKEPYFWHSLRISFLYAFLAVPVTLSAGLGAALLLNQKLPAMGAFRTLFYLPSILPVAASGIMWSFFLNPKFGVINKVLALVGIKGPGWLFDPKWALPSLVIIALWGFGGSMLIFLAGLKNIPASLYEAASLDGAGPIRQFFNITLPMLSPVIFFNVTTGVIHALQIFDVAYVVGSVGPGLGEPEKSTYFYVLNLYEKSFINLQMGLGAAMAWVLFAIILAITAANFSIRKYWVFEGGDV